MILCSRQLTILPLPFPGLFFRAELSVQPLRLLCNSTTVAHVTNSEDSWTLANVLFYFIHLAFF